MQHQLKYFLCCQLSAPLFVYFIVKAILKVLMGGTNYLVAGSADSSSACRGECRFNRYFLCPLYLWQPSWRSKIQNVTLKKMKKTLLFRGDGFTTESHSELYYPIVKGGRLDSEKLCFPLFVLELKVFCCDHSFTMSLIAAVINYKFSQPNADYQQSIL